MLRYLVIAGALALSHLPATAQNGWGSSWSPHQAYDARRDGDILKLHQITKMLQRDYGGRLLDARLQARNGQTPVYIIDWEINGRINVFTVDARTGRVINRRGG